MPNTVLTLGPFSFNGLEAPDRIVLKTKQRLIVHHLGSGSSTIDSLGDDYQFVSFRGVFSGVNATARIGSVELLRNQGNVLSLTWESRTLRVIILTFELDYQSSSWITYRLSCQVLPENYPDARNQPDVLTESAAALVGEIGALLQRADTVLTPGDTADLTVLAALDYDAAPASALNTAKRAIQTIDENMSQFERISPVGSFADRDRPTAQAQWLTEFTRTSGKQAFLMFGKNRLVYVLIRAERVNQL